MNYSKNDIQKLIEDLRGNPNSDLTPENLAEALSHSTITNNKENLWQDFLEFIHSNNLTTQDLINGTNSVFEYINNKADLNNEAFDDLFSFIASTPSYSTSTNRFWNESVNDLIATFINSYGVKLEDGTYSYNASENQSFKNDNTADSHIWKVDDIRYGDAGYTFTFNTQDWVKAWTNVDGKSFYAIEGINAIPSVVNKEPKVQFTRLKYMLNDQGETTNIKDKWLRLLMPQNNRRVEVLDLNRNFWVIGQVLSAISAFLFGDEGGFAAVSKKILNEQVHLWENIAYLWLLLATYYNAASPYFHIMVLPVPSNQYYTERRYDVYNILSDLSMIGGRFEHLIDTYHNTNFIVIPEVYKDAWGENNFRTISYPGMLVHRAKSDSFINIEFKYENATPTFSFKSNGTGVVDLQNYVYGYNIDENSDRVRYNNHFDQIDNTEDKVSMRYTCAVRTIVSFNGNNYPYIRDGKIVIPTLTIYPYDVGKSFATGQQSATSAFLQSDIVIEVTDSDINLPFSVQGYIHTNQEGQFYETNLKSAAYIPECISYYTKSLNPSPNDNNEEEKTSLSYNLNTKSVPLIPIFGVKEKGNYASAAQDTNEQKNVEKFIRDYQNGTNIQGFNSNPSENKEKDILKSYSLAQNSSNSISKNVILYYGAHPYGLWRDSSNTLPVKKRQYYKYATNKKAILTTDNETLVWRKSESGLSTNLYQHNYDHNSLQLYSSAVLYVPPFEGEEEGQYKVYPKYWFYTTNEKRCSKVQKDGRYHYWNKANTFTYYNPQMGPNGKWAIRLVQVCGSTNLYEPKNFDTGFEKPYNAVSLRVKSHLFFEDGTYASKQWDRQLKQSEKDYYYVPTYTWKVTQTIGNYDTLRKTLDKETNYKVQRKDKYDFEKYKDLGDRSAPLQWNILDE